MANRCQDRSGGRAMTMVRYEVRGRVALTTIDNPPVNALNAAVRAGLAEAIQKANADAAVVALVIAAEGKAFIAGADISEFGKPPVAPFLPDVLDAIATSPSRWSRRSRAWRSAEGSSSRSPVRAASRWPGPSLACPEIKLGLIPGAERHAASTATDQRRRPSR